MQNCIAGMRSSDGFAGWLGFPRRLQSPKILLQSTIRGGNQPDPRIEARALVARTPLNSDALLFPPNMLIFKYYPDNKRK
jgi:hypothetical protein